MKPFLPQDDPNQEKRKDYLHRQQKAYQFDYESLSPLALLKNVPAVENFSSKYIGERILATSELPANMLAADSRTFFDPLDELQDYEDFFTRLPLPAVAKIYQTDRSFAEQRLSGANPMVLRLLDASDPRTQILADISNLHPLFDLRRELQKNNIYIADYTGTDEHYRAPALVGGGTYEKGRKYLPKPLAFFAWRWTGVRDLGEMTPIAIQLDPNPGSHVYTPLDPPVDWLFAKLCVQVADANHHEMSSHLGRTHLVMEPIAIVTARQLAQNHPLSLLLKPHFRFMLINNELARSSLIAPGGPVDELLGGTLAETMELSREACSTWSLDRFALPAELKNRGMDDPNQLPHYPYRDDGLLLWDAIETFASGYLKYFYPTDEAIVQDVELQTWAQELASETGGKVKGMPSKIDTVEQLIAIVTTVIFTCGPQHSAVNFPQYEYMAFAANMPLAAYRDIPKITASGTLEVITPKDILRLLPPYKRAADQLKIMFILAAYRYDRLGYYDKSFRELYHMSFDEVFAATPIQFLVRQFQQNLNIAEQKIDANNQKRVIPYFSLKPSLVINSISI
ncbi:lipoxygenase [Microcoleus sp. LEGE 07076]|uniref:lipoxygenase family protein n=1 Tax=Microcoleus sp. LEGE 07076 TaxID=915322 RepID=UPI001882ABA5|nr:lipoxygenase family protein [Microcoleus sp. LEGE 07076]MBE9184797.1 lipoxygenase [Microcoleus sp. LEGE 07076]